MLNIVQGHRHRLLQQSAFFEFVGVNQRPDQASVDFFVGSGIVVPLEGGCFGRLRGERFVILEEGSTGVRLGCWIRLTGSGRSGISLGGPLLLTWGKGTVELTIDEEVGQDATGGPGNAVGPAFDARRGLLVDENIAADDECVALPIMGPARAMLQDALKAGLEDEQGILGSFDVTVPSRDTGRRFR